MPGSAGQKRGKSAPQTKPSKTDLVKEAHRARRGGDANNPLRKQDYDLHRQRVDSAKPMVDCSSPIVVRNTYTTPANFNRSVKNFVNIERENARMLARIATIMKEPASVDNRLGYAMDKMNNRSQARERAYLRIAFDNMEMYKRINTTKPVYSRTQQLKDYAEAEKVMEISSYYPLFWKPPPPDPESTANAKSNPRPTVFFDLETDEDSLGQIVIELRADIVPLTAEYFRKLCTGASGSSYKCSEIHRIVPDILWQGGDISGKGGDGSFPDENFVLKHNEKGVVSMCNTGKNSNGTQFMIMAKKIAALDGVNVVIGKVTSGMGVLDSLNEFVTPSGTIKKKIWIANCGSTDDSDDKEEGAGGDGRQQGQIEDKKNDNEAPEESKGKQSQSAIEENPGSAIDGKSDWDDNAPSSATEENTADPPAATTNEE